MAISGTSNYEIEVPCLVAKGLFGCGFSMVFNHLAGNSHKNPDLRGISRYPIFRHLLDRHLVLEQLRTKPSLFHPLCVVSMNSRTQGKSRLDMA